MRKKRTKAYLVVLAFLVLVGIVSVTAYATGPTPINPDQIETVTDKSKEFALDAYASHMSDTGWNPLRVLSAATWLNAFANVFFDANKIIYSMFSKGIELFGQESVVSDYVGTFTAYSETIYNTLYASFGKTIIACMAIYIFYLLYTKGSKVAMRQFLSFACVLVFSFAWNSKASVFINWFNDLSNEAQSSLVSGVSASQQTTATNSVMMAQNALFELAIEEPYLLMNYGTANSEEIITLENPTIISDLLYAGDPTKEEFEKIEKNVNAQAEDNIFLQKDKASWKFVVGLFSPVMTVLLGVPLLALQFLNLLTGVVALLISSLLGLAMFLSLIPQFKQAVWKVFKLLVGTFGVRILLGIAFMLLISVIQVIRGAIPTDGIASYLLQVCCIAVTIHSIWKYRDKLVSVVSGGMLKSMDHGLWNRASAPIKDTVKGASKTGVDVAGLALTGVAPSTLDVSKKMKSGAQSIFDDRQDRKVNRALDDLLDFQQEQKNPTPTEPEEPVLPENEKDRDQKYEEDNENKQEPGTDVPATPDDKEPDPKNTYDEPETAPAANDPQRPELTPGDLALESRDQAIQPDQQPEDVFIDPADLFNEDRVKSMEDSGNSEDFEMELAAQREIRVHIAGDPLPLAESTQVENPGIEPAVPNDWSEGIVDPLRMEEVKLIKETVPVVSEESQALFAEKLAQLRGV